MSETAQAQTSPHGAATPPDKLPLLDIVKSLTIAQAWALIGCLVAVIGGSAALGSWAQSAHDDSKIAEKNATIQEQKNKSDQDTANVEAARNALRAMEAGERALKGKVEFLDRFLAYRLNAQDPTKSLFVNHVCALWKQSQELAIHLDKAPLRLSDLELRSGLTPAVRKFLTDNGVPSNFLDQAAGPQPAQVFPNPPDVTRTPGFAVANVQKIVQGNNLQLEKRIRFFDGTTYEVPNEIAASVHANKDCAPH